MISDTHDALDDRIYWKESVSLSGNGCDVTHICVGKCDRTWVTDEGIKIIQIARIQYLQNLILNKLVKTFFGQDIFGKMFELAKQEQASVYHLHDLQTNRIGEQLKNLAWSPKLVYDVHDPFCKNLVDYHSHKNVAYRFLIMLYAAYLKRWQYKKANVCDLIITTEENLAIDFSKNTGTRVEIIYNYTNLPTPQVCDKTIDVLYCGGITRFRGVFQILEAAKICAERNPDIRFMLIGNISEAGLLKKLRTYIDDNHLQNNVTIHEQVPYQEIGAFYERSKIGLGIFLPIPTHYIILPIKTFEYMHYGLPVVASNFGHIGEYTESEKTGLTVDPTDPQQIADAIQSLLDDAVLYSQCSANGKLAARITYCWDVMEAKLLGIYHSLSK